MSDQYTRERALVAALEAIVKHVFDELPPETSPPNNRLQVIASIAQLAIDEYHEKANR